MYLTILNLTFKRTGKWLPQDHRIHKEWLGGVIEDVDQNSKDLHLVIK
jgi:phosphatidylserine decarboxylase